MYKKPKILVVGSFVMDQIATTDIVPCEGQTVLGKTFHKAPEEKVQIRLFRQHVLAQMSR